MYGLILPLGIITFVLITLQILGSMKTIKISYKTHRYLGITLGVFALIHGTIAIFFT